MNFLIADTFTALAVYNRLAGQDQNAAKLAAMFELQMNPAGNPGLKMHRTGEESRTRTSGRRGSNR